jgi:membrane-associated phospholipid phosphatase
MLGQHADVRAAAAGAASSLGPTDRIALAYAIALAAVAAFCGVHPAVLLAIAAIAAGIVAAPRLAAVSRTGRVVHDFAAVGYVLALYSLSGPVIAAANPMHWDARLAELDRALFGALPAAWIGLWGRPEWLVEASSILYAAYYPIPLAIAIALYRTGRRDEFEAFVFAVVATFLASYVGYFLAPAIGPRLAETQETALTGVAMSPWLRHFIKAVEMNHLDAFPSGHTALSLVYLVLGSRLLPRWRIPLALLSAGIVFSTVYLSLHYVVDLVAGALVAAVMLVVAPALYGALRQRPSSKARHPRSLQPIRSKRPPR